MKMKKRAYTLKKRAESQAETRQRIIEAAVGLHRDVGPAHTTVSMVAERAGVQRHTFYAHFPDDRSLLMACSGHNAEQNPYPASGPWKEIADHDERLVTALGELYAYYARNEQMTASVLRDAEIMPLVKEIVGIRRASIIRAYRETLGEKRNENQRAMLALALSFHTWRSLVRDAGLSSKAAAQQMAQAVITTK